MSIEPLKGTSQVVPEFTIIAETRYCVLMGELFIFYQKARLNPGNLSLRQITLLGNEI